MPPPPSMQAPGMQAPGQPPPPGIFMPAGAPHMGAPPPPPQAAPEEPAGGGLVSAEEWASAHPGP
eukprot:2395242-Rhodomonas_salina.1